MATATSSSSVRLIDSSSLDYLSKLPVEILTDIFELAYVNHTPTGLLSRALLPFDRASRFERVKVDGPRRLVQLAETLDSSSVGSYIKDLTLEGVDRNGALALTEHQFRAFFAALPHLRHLELRETSQAVIHLLVSGRIPCTSLAAMRELLLHAEDNPEQPFDPVPFRGLASYPSLTTLFLNLDDYNYDWDEAGEVPAQSVVLPGLKDLTLLSEGAHLPIANRFIQACPAVQHLCLISLSSQPAYTSLLLSLPPTLLTLELRTPDATKTWSSPCDASLPRFRELQHLHLGQGTFSADIFEMIRLIPGLTTLGFGLGAYLDASKLERLVCGSTRFQQLRVLTLDVVWAKHGWIAERAAAEREAGR
ncbi:hypothetical protein JCM8097_004682 [Rhodosporidiobolus ruineniae]